MKTMILMTAMLMGSVAMARGGAADPVKQTNGGLLGEAVEHSIRLQFQSDATVLSQTASASAAYLADGTILVALRTSSGTVKEYSCFVFDDTSRGGTIVKKDVNCRAR